jgi:HD-GYP domain-containing protein (c-di-GMP phosphodiesterase class II)
MPPKSAEKFVADMTAEEVIDYHLYPERSVTMVKSKKVPLPNDVSDAIGQHREKGGNKGFPKKLNLADMTDMGKLMAVTYQFHELTVLGQGKAAMLPAQAITAIRDNSLTGAGEYDLITATQIFKKFKA